MMTDNAVIKLFGKFDNDEIELFGKFSTLRCSDLDLPEHISWTFYLRSKSEKILRSDCLF